MYFVKYNVDQNILLVPRRSRAMVYCDLSGAAFSDG